MTIIRIHFDILLKNRLKIRQTKTHPKPGWEPCEMALGDNYLEITRCVRPWTGRMFCPV
jgi:hypothetical protein